MARRTTKPARLPSQKAMQELLAEFYPHYDPVLSLARIAMDCEARGDMALAIAANREVAKYVRPQLKHLEYSGVVAEQSDGRLEIVHVMEQAPDGSKD